MRACGARERARARERERSGQRRETAERAEAGESGAERGAGSRESTGQRDSIADGTALRNIVGEEVAATFRSRCLRMSASLFYVGHVTLFIAE